MGTIITQDLNQDQNINLSPTAKGLNLFTAFLSLAKLKKEGKSKPNIKSIQKLGNTWNKSKGKVERKGETDLKKRVNILFHFESDC